MRVDSPPDMSPLARLGFLILLGVAPLASAGPSKVRLDYVRDASAMECFTQESLRESLSALLGRDPLDDSAPELLRVHVRREAGIWQGTVELFDAAGKRRGRRELSSTLEDCQELRQALELAITLTLDPPLFGKPESPPPPSLPPAPAPVQSVQPPVRSVEVASAEAPSRAPGVALGLGTRLSWGLLPESEPGFDVEGGLRLERFSFSLGATAWLPRTYQFERGGLRSRLVTATARACVHSGPFGACPQFSAGLLWGEGVNLENTRNARAPWLSPGARLFAGWNPPTLGVQLRVLVEGQLVLTRNHFLAGDVSLWQTPLFGGSLGLMAVWESGP